MVRIGWTKRSVRALLFLVPLACGDGWVEIHGTVVSSADQRPVPGATIRLYFDRSELGDLSCDEAGQPRRTSKADDAGRFETQPIGYQGCQSCKRGQLCVSQVGFKTARIDFSDCETDGIRSEENAVIELEPE